MTSFLKRGSILAMVMPVVLLAGCVSAQKYDALKADNQQVIAKNGELEAQNQQLEKSLASAKMQITRLQGAVKYSVNSDLLFPPGGWELSTRGQETIGKMAQMLASQQQSKIVVNGYTDNAAVGPGLVREGITSNLILSERRANAVLEYMVSQGVKPDMVSSLGHGDADPLAPNNTAQGRAQNRRVEVTLAAPGT